MADVEVEVIFAEPERAWVRRVTMTDGATVREAIEASGILGDVPALDLARNRVGIYGMLVKLEDRISVGDRIEIYRPLLADPKEIRRRRARTKSAR